MPSLSYDLVEGTHKDLFCRGIARTLQRGFTWCQSEGTHQIVMSFLGGAVASWLVRSSPDQAVQF